MTTAGQMGGTAVRDRARRGGGAHVPRARWLYWVAILLVILVGLAVVIRVIVDPIATHYTRQGLKEAKGISVDFQRVHVTLLPPGYEIRRFKMRDGSRTREPLLYVPTARVSIDWRQLFHGRLNASLTLDRPKVTVVNRASGQSAPEDEGDADESDAKPATPRAKPKAKSSAGVSDIERSLQQLLPLRVDRVDVVDGEILLRDSTVETTPEIWVNRIDATLKNVASRRELTDGRPATLALSGRLGRSGVIAMKLSADPFANPLKFDGELNLRDWKLIELYDVLKAKAEVQATAGTVGLYVKFKVRNNAISGKVKPVLENVKLESTSEDVGDRVKAWVANKALQLTGDRDDNRGVGVEVPIQGRLDPNEELGPAVVDVVRNAFAQGIKVGLGGAAKAK